MNIGNKMAELENKYNSGQPPYLTDTECMDLRDWYENLYEYSYDTKSHINTLYFANRMTEMKNILIARKCKG